MSAPVKYVPVPSFQEPLHSNGPQNCKYSSEPLLFGSQGNQFLKISGSGTPNRQSQCQFALVFLLFQ